MRSRWQTGLLSQEYYLVYSSNLFWCLTTRIKTKSDIVLSRIHCFITLITTWMSDVVIVSLIRVEVEAYTKKLIEVENAWKEK